MLQGGSCEGQGGRACSVQALGEGLCRKSEGLLSYSCKATLKQEKKNKGIDFVSSHHVQQICFIYSINSL